MSGSCGSVLETHVDDVDGGVPERSILEWKFRDSDSKQLLRSYGLNCSDTSERCDLKLKWRSEL